MSKRVDQLRLTINDLVSHYGRQDPMIQHLLTELDVLVMADHPPPEKRRAPKRLSAFATPAKVLYRAQSALGA